MERHPLMLPKERMDGVKWIGAVAEAAAPTPHASV
jgi:hypothetical protein